MIRLKQIESENSGRTLDFALSYCTEGNCVRDLRAEPQNEEGSCHEREPVESWRGIGLKV